MARPRLTDGHKDTRRTVRFTEAEDERVAARANQAGCTVSEFLRAAAMSREPMTPTRGRAPVKDAQLLGYASGQLGRIGNNLNQMAHLANCGSWPHGPALEQSLAELRECQCAIMTALGVRPPAADCPATDEKPEDLAR